MKIRPAFSYSATLAALLFTAVLLSSCQTKEGRCRQDAMPDGAGVQETGELAAMQLGTLPMSGESGEIVSPIDAHASSQVFQYQMDASMKELHFFVEEFRDGKLTCLAQTGGPAPQSGTFALSLDPDEITLNWDGGKYSCIIDSVSTYRSSSTSCQEFISEVQYNIKAALYMIAYGQSNSMEQADVAVYHELLGLEETQFDRVLFVTAAFTDFDVEEELVSWNGIVRDKAKLSQETQRWLENYNKMDRFSQLSLSHIPAEFISLTPETAPVNAVTLGEILLDIPADTDQVLEIEGGRNRGLDEKNSAPEDRLLMVDGTIYRGTAKTGPMGDAGCVDGKILSAVNPDAVPTEHGQSNFGGVGNPYTFDGGDGFIMVFLDDEWYCFYSEAEAEPAGNFCAFVDRIDGNFLYVDMAEWITDEDLDKMQKLRLTEDDMPDGYYIDNPSKSLTKLPLTDRTHYCFIDWNHDFSSSEEPKLTTIETTDKELFQKYLDTYADSKPGMPFFIEVKDGAVTEIAEKPLA